MKNPTHIYCDNCLEITPAIITNYSGMSVCDRFVGRDVVCGECSLVVSTEFIAIEELKD